jgi:hypothetical protein
MEVNPELDSRKLAAHSNSCVALRQEGRKAVVPYSREHRDESAEPGWLELGGLIHFLKGL